MKKILILVLDSIRTVVSFVLNREEKFYELLPKIEECYHD